MDRVLFFSLFVKNLNPRLLKNSYEQLEFGVVPPYSELIMKLQDEHDGVTEYELVYKTPYS